MFLESKTQNVADLVWLGFWSRQIAKISDARRAAATGDEVAVCVHGSSTVILDYASSLLANALNRHYYFVLLGAAKNIDG